MSNILDISEKFEPLFELLEYEDPNAESPIFKHAEVDTVIITGGRYSMKSYSVSIFSLLAMYLNEWSVLYTRFTNSSIVDSVKPEVSDKVEMLGLTDIVNDMETRIEFKNSRISFKGIKTGSKSQTANLKSISGFNLFVNDEAEELPDYKTFKKIFYSIRSLTTRNLSILILNPTSKQHWIFTEFYEKKGLQGGENCIIDNVMYIHSSYLDADHNIMPQNILRDYERMKIDSPKEYENIVLGGWIDEPEGVLVPKSKCKFEDLSKFPDECVHFRFAVGDPADKGGNKFSMPFIDVVVDDSSIAFLVRCVIHSTAGIEANSERVHDKMQICKTEQVFIESNGVGLAAVLELKRRIASHQKLTPFPSTENKEVRIHSHYEFIPKYFIFDENYASDPEYLSFINDLTLYSTESDNKDKKDAIDVCCAIVQLMKIKYRSVFYSKY